MGLLRTTAALALADTSNFSAANSPPAPELKAKNPAYRAVIPFCRQTHEPEIW